MTQQPQSIVPPGQQSAVPVQKEHIVAAGESLEQIAKNYGVSTKQVRRLNSIGGPVQPGQKLKIPAPKPVAVTFPPATSAKTTPTGTTPGATK
jgi:LysM repeat protein